MLFIVYSYFEIIFILNLNPHISQRQERTSASHFSKHGLCTLAMVPRHTQGEMHLFDSSMSGSKQILQRPGLSDVIKKENNLAIKTRIYSVF